MSNGLRAASWIVTIACVALCDIGIFLMLGLTLMENSESMVVGALASGLSETVVPLLWMLIPAAQLASFVVGIVAATRRSAEGLATTRAIMLTFKLGLIPFFVLGGIVEIVLMIAGFHPILVGFGWMLGFLAGILGGITMVSGSVWAIATAAKMRRLGQITAGEFVAHVILQLIFVADFIDAIVLFISSKKALEMQVTPTTRSTMNAEAGGSNGLA